MDRNKIIEIVAQLYIIALSKTKKIQSKNYYTTYLLFTHWGIFLNPKEVYEYLIANALISFEEKEDVSSGKFIISGKGNFLIETIKVNDLLEPLNGLEDIKIDKIKSFVLPAGT
jgi:hypothetical protein